MIKYQRKFISLIFRLEIIKEKIRFNEQLVQLQLFDINKAFLKSSLSKTYFDLAHSIIIVVDLNSYCSLFNCFEIIDIIEGHLMSKKISFIIWDEIDNNNKKKISIFSNSNTSEISRKKTSDSFLQPNSISKDIITSPLKKPSITSDTPNEFHRLSLDKSKNTLSELDPMFEKKKDLKDKFMQYCKENKCILIKIKHFSEISVENEVFWNFLKFLMVKKFENSSSFTKINTNKKRMSHFFNKNDFNLGKEKSFNKGNDKIVKNKSAEKNNYRKSTIN